jgi:serine protease Do
MKSLLLVLFLASYQLSLGGQDISCLYDSVISSVVMIHTEESSENHAKGFVVTEEGLGSGVLIEGNQILTAAHVIQTATDVTVQFSDGEKIPARILSSVPSADVALLELEWEPKNKKASKLGDSDKVRTGHQIIMIGTPLDQEFSLSIGHISGRRILKKIANGQKWIEYFQTDAAINPGNSGGPMFNMKGEVIGIASYILSESGGFEGLGFAATSNICKSLLLEGKSVWSGLEGIFINGKLANILNVPQGSGILVQKVSSLSPADTFGIKGSDFDAVIEEQELKIGGDIILSVNGIKVLNEDSIITITQNLQTTQDIVLKVLRAGQIITLEGSFE